MTARGKVALSLLERNTSGRDTAIENDGTVFKSGMLVEVML
ncbi:MAG TPA: hypothetical protein V6D17_03770 [Candidatus Obscuribacterales bacterium]